MEHIKSLKQSRRIETLKEAMLSEPRYMSIEQACITTAVYKKNPNAPVPILRATALAETMQKIAVRITPGEL
ncbi:MAG: hypothetical protein FWE82_06815, partial [Defluviitaleaceae bacterium]|nr:hypothetical protein [Defluviitaleaceae bacterium]